MESAPTPGMSGGDEDDSTPTWLVEPVFQGKKVLVEITGTLGGWHGGELDGLKGYVTNTFRSSNDILVTIEHVDSGRVGTSVEVPVVYLSSVHPSQMGDHAVPLEGPARGNEVVLRQLLTIGVWEVSKPSDSTLFTCFEEKMVQLHVGM